MHMPLHIASIHGSSKVAMTLLKLGANANARCRGGWTPLHECSANGHATVAEALHSKGGADLEARGDGGWTALHVAQTITIHKALPLLLPEWEPSL